MSKFTDELPRRRIKLNQSERRAAIEGLRRMQTITGIDLVGERARSIQERFERFDTSVNLPEFNTLGFALSRLDTPQGYKLLKRLTGAANGEPAKTVHEMLAGKVAAAWARVFGRSGGSPDRNSRAD